MSRFSVGSRYPKTKRYMEYISSPQWWRKRQEKLRETSECQRCASKEQLEVHHLTYERLGDERMEDLEVVCNPCHFREHSSMGSLIDSFFKNLSKGAQ